MQNVLDLPCLYTYPPNIYLKYTLAHGSTIAFEVSKKEYNTICIICDEILQIMVRNIFDFFSQINYLLWTRFLQHVLGTPLEFYYHLTLQECLKCITKTVDLFILLKLIYFLGCFKFHMFMFAMPIVQLIIFLQLLMCHTCTNIINILICLIYDLCLLDNYIG